MVVRGGLAWTIRALVCTAAISLGNPQMLGVEAVGIFERDESLRLGVSVRAVFLVPGEALLVAQVAVVDKRVDQMAVGGVP